MFANPTQTILPTTPTPDHTFDGLMEEFRRCESEFKTGDDTVQHKIALSVLTTISSGMVMDLTLEPSCPTADLDQDMITTRKYSSMRIGVQKGASRQRHIQPVLPHHSPLSDHSNPNQVHSFVGLVSSNGKKRNITQCELLCQTNFEHGLHQIQPDDLCSL
ncbi:hypothetical protein BLNAU_21469 [Blattamonas nauphoetae]|uniref:Uncharacterized protein n=1 Tax=Blattamonas nauphoetae TaxID=2049346 RepID=A0ABQ9WVS5_9EUKA|nr:hypothetical protein BLNAU_21469 [Blattamonas nauphoetae]